MNLSTSLPENLPWAEHQAFLLLDGAACSDLPARLKKLDPTASSTVLYDCPPFTTLRDISPLLVAVQQPDEPIIQFYLDHAHEEWGVLLFSLESGNAVAQHLRKLLIVELPEGLPVLLRVADASVARTLFASADQRLFGPLSCVVTADSVAADWQRHAPRLAVCPDLPTPYRLSAEQNSALEHNDRRRVLLELDAHLLRFFPERWGGETVAQRWPMLEQLEAEAGALGMSCASELFHYANVMASLDGSPLDQHPHINRLLHAPSLQSPGERVALAADLAHQWAIQRSHS
ncbi:MULTISPECIES: DUF4123 domain-containing protein [unclassified Pseudomonas]|uniref:DUF4123 domain-containing protein n=1 Tax=unclassified Pseudomonas TaxID=196821 RepID=UPI002AC8E7D7|nr:MULTISPECIES: DUF4123 domain-containing protein [unclassified Pseudomonas]MEB0048565.1 DUF4123 domain-containing protein [Pseudomonas sp. Dout3]MEB0097587.1 DUF4123 domain-containing protein [Pseudomonas sp. DC1.2]WPX56776.1 DUF4123 domain-containing protein [Pseudomonas sp. DC1.2]